MVAVDGLIYMLAVVNLEVCNRRRGKSILFDLNINVERGDIGTHNLPC